MRVYLDNAASTPLSDEVITLMTELMRSQYGNPSSIHAEGRNGRALVEKARREIAEALNASIGEIFFTSGGTEANNMALKCAVRDLGIKRIITSPIEHHCVLHAAEAAAEEQGVSVEMVALDERGRVQLDDLAARLDAQPDTPTLVSLMHANNEIGVLLDLEKTAALCAEKGALFHSDTVQTIGHFPIDLANTPVSFLSGSAHKFHGPKGVGFLYINGDNLIKPYIHGGAQERNMRAGTENLYGILGMARALTLATEEMEARRNHIEGLRTYFLEGLKERFPDIQVHTPMEEESLYTVLNVSFPGSAKADMLLFNLDISGVSVSGGSACSSGADAGSHVIQALKVDETRKAIRFSFSHYNTKEELDYALEQLKKALPADEQVSVTS
jgi:cysteine desulfurase